MSKRATLKKIANIDNDIKRTTIELINVMSNLKALENPYEAEEISAADIRAIYNDCKKSLGDLVVREIEEIQEIKKQIGNFKIEILQMQKEDLLASEKRLSLKLDDLQEKQKNLKSKFINE